MTNATSPQPQHAELPTTRPEDGLTLGLQPRRSAVELTLTGELDLAAAPRLLLAMEWLRRRYRSVIVLDTRGLSFVDLAGYRAFDACLKDAAGDRDPRVVYVVGDALAYLQGMLARISGAGPPRLS